MEPAGRPPPAPAPTFLVVGLLGGIGSGKSTVARMLEELGAARLDADRIAAEVLKEPEVVRALAQRFGAAVVPAGGEVNRAALASRIFSEAGEEDRRFVQGLVHPLIRTHMLAEIDRARTAVSGPRLLILDVPLLLEGPVGSWCDRFVFVDTPEEMRIRRCERERKWSRDEVARRESVQLPLEEKRRRAQFVVANDGDLDRLRKSVSALWDQLLGSSATVDPRIKRGARDLPDSPSPRQD